VIIQESIQAGKQEEALGLIADALAHSPKDAGLFNLRGIVYAQRNELKPARADFERAVHLASGLVPAWQNLARSCQLMTGEDSMASRCAIDAWQHVLRARPTDPEARLSLATLFEWQGRFADSLREIEKLPAEESARAAVLAVRCADLAGLHRLDEAAEVAMRLTHAPAFSEADVKSIFPVLEASKSSAIIVTLVEALDAQHAASSQSLRQLAIAYEQLKRLADGRKTLERVARQEPDEKQHLFELARLAYLSRDLEGALGYLAHARDLAPNDSRVHFLFGMVSVELELPLEARKSLEKALALDPHNPDYNYAMGAVLLSRGESAIAIPYFRNYITAQPKDARGHFALGAAYFAAGDYENCREEMQGISNDPKTQAGATYFLGRVARADDKLDEAAGLLERSIALLPSFAEGYTELARTRLRQGRIDQAQSALDRALALDPESFQANSALLALFQRTHDPRATEQAARLQKLDSERSRRWELMLRNIEVKAY
jgi:tetratricopeptide (TPR) repeat protein